MTSRVIYLGTYLRIYLFVYGSFNYAVQYKVSVCLHICLCLSLCGATDQFSVFMRVNLAARHLVGSP
jgi:hypothetical protein